MTGMKMFLFCLLTDLLSDVWSLLVSNVFRIIFNDLLVAHGGQQRLFSDHSKPIKFSSDISDDSYVLFSVLFVSK